MVAGSTLEIHFTLISISERIFSSLLPFLQKHIGVKCRCDCEQARHRLPILDVVSDLDKLVGNSHVQCNDRESLSGKEVHRRHPTQAWRV